MRRSLGWLLAAMLVLTAVPAFSAEQGIPGREEQWVQGSILSPTRFTDGEGGWPGLGRRAWLCSAATNGSIAYIFDVFEETWGGVFVIDDVDDMTGEANVNVYFYESFGDCGGQADPITSGEFATQGPGGEVGYVPPRTTKAVVFTPDGVDTSFTYTAYAPPVIRIGPDNLDLTVARDAVVVWENRTDDYAYVRHLPQSGNPAFDSSPAQGTGIPVGGKWSHTFRTAGEFVYETPSGTGTITVVNSIQDL